jgi:hypothetical protein
MLSKRRIHLWYFNPAGNYGVKTHSHDQTSPFVLHRDRLPELHSTDNVSDPIAKIRLVDPVGQSEVVFGGIQLRNAVGLWVGDH